MPGTAPSSRSASPRSSILGSCGTAISTDCSSPITSRHKASTCCARALSCARSAASCRSRRYVEVYLPIAEQSMNVFLLLALGGTAGLLAGMFGVGGGFLATPLLIFVGIPPAVAVASQANQVVANSISSLQIQLRRGNVDIRMGLVLLLGGMMGSGGGVWLFTYLKSIGQIDFVIAVLYVLLLSSIGTLMLYESASTWLKRRRNPQAPRGKLHTHYLVHRLPFKLRFYKSKLYISALLPIGLGFVIGILSAILGVGGGFVLVPA